jgi:hypothetical protein
MPYDVLQFLTPPVPRQARQWKVLSPQDTGERAVRLPTVLNEPRSRTAESTMADLKGRDQAPLNLLPAPIGQSHVAHFQVWLGRRDSPPLKNKQDWYCCGPTIDGFGKYTATTRECLNQPDREQNSEKRDEASPSQPVSRIADQDLQRRLLR